jgi:3-deoxy-manno-octulosonate cytidylyltransferase (CMP-KDO synthetase)
MAEVIGIIPARYASTRFPGKLLAPILGKTLIQRTYENAKRCKVLDQVVIATDDQRIFDHVQQFQGQVVMTSDSCLTGTDRLAEAVQRYPLFSKAKIIINIQGDEPMLDPTVIQKVVEVLQQDPSADVSTAIIKITSEEEARNPSVTKCVINKRGYALYFSRGLIPSNKMLKYDPEVTYYKHLGIYGYRLDFLLHYAELSPTPLQLAEDLEQLKVLEHGFRIKAAIVECECMDVNTPEDIKKVEQLLCKQNTSSSQAGSVHL